MMTLPGVASRWLSRFRSSGAGWQPQHAACFSGEEGVEAAVRRMSGMAAGTSGKGVEPAAGADSSTPSPPSSSSPAAPATPAAAKTPKQFQEDARRERMLQRARERVESSDLGDLAARQRLLETVKSKGRFYRTVNVKPSADLKGFQVYLDRHAVKTPAMRHVVVPTVELALAVAAEWEWQASGKPAVHSMPMMGLVATAIDQPKPRAKVLESTLRYIHTDSACCRYEAGKLADRQAKAFDPLLQWAHETLGWQLTTSEALTGAPQTDECEGRVQRMLSGLNSWELTAVEQLTAASKSLVVAAAVLHGRLSADDAVALARLEEEYQLEDWGAVEAGHDLDRADAISRVLSASVLLRMLALQQRPTSSA